MLLYLKRINARLTMIPGSARSISTLVLASLVLGCGSNKTTTSDMPTPPVQGPQTYFSPFVAGTTNGPSNVLLTGAKTFAIDDHANTFSESTFQLQLPQQQGPQVINFGCFISQPQCTPIPSIGAAGQRGLLNLGITTNYVSDSTSGVFEATTYDPPQMGSFAVELPSQAGGLIQLVGQPVAPLVAATQCPNLKTAQTYQFVTVPAGLSNSTTSRPSGSWNPKLETAYGMVDISSDGTKVTFDNIRQYTFPVTGSSGNPSQPASPSVSGACGATVFGNTITIGQLTVTDPVSGGPASNPPQASIAIGPTGLLVEDNGSDPDGLSLPGTSPSLFYDNTLGAGTGAVGLPKPSGAVDIGALRNAQYLGFTYGAGVFSGNAFAPPNGWSSHLASFGFSSTPASCASFAAQTGALVNGIYGGDYPQANGQDNPSASPDGFGNCDLAIDLGTQDTANNGLFPHATVWLGSSYVANTTGATYSFPAVAIAGQLNGKNAIFVLGIDSTQPWAMYLLQSN